MPRKKRTKGLPVQKKSKAQDRPEVVQPVDRPPESYLHVSLRKEGAYEAAQQYMLDTDHLEWTSRYGRITLGNWMLFRKNEKHLPEAYNFEGWIQHRRQLIASGILRRVHEFERT